MLSLVNCVSISQFSGIAVEIQRKLDVLANACREIKESARLRVVLETILVIGNVMNEGTHKGGAQGFTLDRFDAGCGACSFVLLFCARVTRDWHAGECSPAPLLPQHAHTPAC